MTEREVVLIDMDCFYVQVEQRLNPSLKGKPCAVVQYKTWKGGGIIAVGYEARACGVTRQMRGDDAKAMCPEIHLARVPEVRGKADLTRYREAGAEVIAIFSKFCSCVERASVDEAYLDLTMEVTQRMTGMAESPVKDVQLPNTFVEAYDGADGKNEWLQKIYSDASVDKCEQRLAVAACLVEEMRAAVFKDTGFTCSAGIAHNKMLAKLACGRNKPNKQTVLPHSSVPSVFSTLPLQKIRHLGGKLGASIIELGCKMMGDVTRFSELELQKHCGNKAGSWLYYACRGIDTEPVAVRELPKSIGCSKMFMGKEALDTTSKIKQWLSELAEEVMERLSRDRDANKRIAKSLTVNVGFKTDSGYSSSSRTCALVRYEAEKFASDALALLQQFKGSPNHSSVWTRPFNYLGLTASKFHPLEEQNKISSMFTAAACSTSTCNQSDGDQVDGVDWGDLNGDLQSKSTMNVPSTQSKTDHNHFKESSRKSLNNSLNSSPSTKPADMGNNQNGSKGERSIKSFFSQIKVVDRKPPQPSDSEGREEVMPVELPQVNTAKASSFFAGKLKALSTKNESPESGSTTNVIQEFSDEDASLEKTSDVCSAAVLDVRKSDEQSPTVLTNKTETNQLSPNIHINQVSPNLNEMNQVSPNLSKTNQVSPNDSEDYIECDKCGQIISMWELPEHNDFHFAQELQNQSDHSAGGSTQVARSSIEQKVKRKFTSPTKESKRGRKKKKSLDKNIQPLTAFFSKT
ncbi:DNA polymerase eta-like [Physella acuta]|uniref:DNA polymerase eta-like n=1 Tax=Physella acuta TaxID=109671 RepID=UPI0027DE54CC|nr:DNA polymerase eta-like [Physella acuta]